MREAALARDDRNVGEVPGGDIQPPSPTPGIRLASDRRNFHLFRLRGPSRQVDRIVATVPMISATKILRTKDNKSIFTLKLAANVLPRREIDLLGRNHSSNVPRETCGVERALLNRVRHRHGQ